jgi:predicted DsbA family dithiol-disulfide isomerase
VPETSDHADPTRPADPDGSPGERLSRPAAVEFFFDPMCPWAYQTSVWIREVRRLSGLEITWRFFSLEEINRVEGKKHAWEREWSYGFSQMRVGALLRRQGQDQLDRWYEQIGRAFHEQGRPTHEREIHGEVLEELGWDRGLVDEALADPTTADEVRADHDFVTGEKAAWGVPTLVFPDGQAVFGPVIAPAVLGEPALRLWDLVVGWNEFPHLYELQRPKRPDDLAAIAATFRPYLEARSWNSVANPTP